LWNNYEVEDQCYESANLHLANAIDTIQQISAYDPHMIPIRIQKPEI